MRRRRQATCAPVESLWSVVLAAGASQRLGRPKQLVRAGRATLAARAVELADRLTPGRVVVVVGAHALRLRAHLRRARLEPRLVHNGAWASGQSTSLRCGIDALPRNARAALVLVVDQPDVDAATLQRLVRAWQAAPTRIAAARYAGRCGVPAIFPRRAFAALKRQSGDRGARGLLRQYGSALTTVPMPEARFDVDTIEDLAAMTRRSLRASPGLGASRNSPTRSGRRRNALSSRPADGP